MSSNAFSTLAGLLALTLYVGQAQSKNIAPQQTTENRDGFDIRTGSTRQISQGQQVRNRQHDINPQGTLYGENAGDFIILDWDLNDSATEYFVYRSTSASGPWKQVLRTSQGAARTGGARQDFTPDARLMDLCYKVEAIDAKGLVIELYEPICVPKFKP